MTETNRSPQTVSELCQYLTDHPYGTWSEGDAAGAFKCVDVVDCGDSRWMRNEEAIVVHVPTGLHYAFAQAVGLTECQESEIYDNKVWMVVKQTRVVETTEWVKK